VAASVEAGRYVVDATSFQQTRSLGPEPRWVDRATDAPAAYLYDGNSEWDAVWANLFWNGRIDAVYDLPGVAIVGPLPQRRAVIRPDGTLVDGDGRPLRERGLVASSVFVFRGEPLATAPQQLPGQGALRLWRLDPPARLSTRTRDLATNGDIYGGGAASMTVFDCGPGALQLTLLVKEPQTVDLQRNGRLWRRLRFGAPTTWRGGMPAARPTRGGQCSFTIRPTGLLGTTVFEFTRAP
jgi:hypothetical protein